MYGSIFVYEQPHVQTFAMLNKAESQPQLQLSDKLELLQYTESIRAGLLNSYLESKFYIY
jgi:hypothetical protein